MELTFNTLTCALIVGSDLGLAMTRALFKISGLEASCLACAS